MPSRASQASQAQQPVADHRDTGDAPRIRPSSPGWLGAASFSRHTVNYTPLEMFGYSPFEMFGYFLKGITCGLTRFGITGALTLLMLATKQRRSSSRTTFKYGTLPLDRLVYVIIIETYKYQREH